MPLSINDGATWRPVKKAWVWDGSLWRPIKSYKAWNLTTWKLAWAPLMDGVTLSLSKSPVATTEAYTVTVNIPEGVPEGGSIRLYRNGSLATTLTPAAGALSADYAQAAHSSAGAYVWTASCDSAGGTTTAQGITQTATAAATEVTVSGGHCHQINAGLAQAKASGLPLRLTGNFYLYTDVLIPDGVYVNATGAMFYCSSTSAVENATYDSGRIKNETNGNAPEYGQAGNFTWDGGTFDGNGEGIMTFSHSPGFTIKNATFYNYCASNNTGHALEINSSGGVDNKTGPYTVQILNNTFLGTNRGQRTNGNDEPVQWDWNWNGSGGSAPVWNPGDTISEATQVMCHNLLIQGNTFSRRTSAYAYALCAIGGHKSADASMTSSYRHNHVLIQSNHITGSVGSSGTNPDKGAIHSFFTRQGDVKNNTLVSCNANRLITGENATDITYCTASGNTHNGAAAGNTYVVSNATGA